MGIGSLVELVNDNWTHNFRQQVNLPVKGKIYTIRKIRDLGDGPALLLEEINNPIATDIRGRTAEPAFFIHRFRELLPPMSIASEINKEEVQWV
jgi:hypothetical protein